MPRRQAASVEEEDGSLPSLNAALSGLPVDRNDSRPVAETPSQMEGIVAEIARTHRLSPQETRILEAAARGQSSKEVAFDLGISRRTVDCYWRQIFAKLRCRSQLEVLALLLRRVTGEEQRSEAGQVASGMDAPERATRRR